MKKTLVALVAAMSLAVAPISSTSAHSNPATEGPLAVGLMIKYREGVAPVAPNGQVTGANFAGEVLEAPRDIGNGVTAVSFPNALSQTEAAELAKNLGRDPRVEAVEVDHYLEAPGAAKASENLLLANSLATLIRPATAPLNPVVRDRWASTAPYAARVQLSWTAPKSLYGAKLAGFQIWRSVNGGKFVLAQTITNPRVRSVYLSAGLIVGRLAKFNVRAVTKVGTAVKVGLASRTVSITPTARPATPILAGYVDQDLTKPTWLPQNVTERGGLPVTYTVSASATGKATLTCTTTSTSCTLNGLDPATKYKVVLVAKNSRGNSGSVSGVRPTDPYFYQQWYLFGKYGINAPGAWAQLPDYTTQDVVVAVLDSGVTSHPDLDSQMVPGYDFVSADMVPNDGDGWDADGSDPGSFTSDPSSTSAWHGTHVAGLIGAAHNTTGIAGAAPGVKLQSVRALGATGGKQSDLFAAIVWASGGAIVGVPTNPTPAKVINISMGTSSPSSCGVLVQSAVTDTIAKGVTIITSAGNGDAENQPMPAFDSYPGNCLGTINVGATASNGDASYYSNYGLGVDISAPGGDDRVTVGTTVEASGSILSTYNTGSRLPGEASYAFDEGTSMAAPLVSSTVAMMYFKNPNLTVLQVWTYLKASAKPFAPGTTCALTARSEIQRCGVGIVDASAALRLVK
ncbi:MAG: hypothetical protein RLZZ108_1043 [Actinomycetota bacterium]